MLVQFRASWRPAPALLQTRWHDALNPLVAEGSLPGYDDGRIGVLQQQVGATIDRDLHALHAASPIRRVQLVVVVAVPTTATLDAVLYSGSLQLMTLRTARVELDVRLPGEGE